MHVELSERTLGQAPSRLLIEAGGDLGAHLKAALIEGARHLRQHALVRALFAEPDPEGHVEDAVLEHLAVAKAMIPLCPLGGRAVPSRKSTL